MKSIFICHSPFQYYTFKSISKHVEDSYFIIPPFKDKIVTPEYGGGMSEKGLYEYVEDFLQTKKVEVVNYGERTAGNVAKFLNENASNVVLSHWFDGIYLLNKLRIIRVIYGLADKGGSTYSILNNYLMDLILTYGPDSANKFNRQGIMAQPIGNPIFDEWFNNDIGEEKTRFIERRLDDKPTILYLPTFSSFSRIEKFFDAVVSLSSEYNIIIKVHHGTFNGEANRLCKLLSHPELIVLGDYVDPQPLYKLADIVLVENSGALYDALLVKKPVIILGASLVNGGYDIYEEGEKTSDVEKFDVVPSTNEPGELERLIVDNLQKELKLDENLRYSLFFKNDGEAGRRAAEIIMNNEEYPSIPMLDKYDRALKRVYEVEEREIIQKWKNTFVQKYYPDGMKETSLISRIYRPLFRN